MKNKKPIENNIKIILEMLPHLQEEYDRTGKIDNKSIIGDSDPPFDSYQDFLDVIQK